MKFYKIAALILIGCLTGNHIQAQKLIDLNKTDDMTKHTYPEKKKPLDVVLLNVSQWNSSENINLSAYKNLQVLRIENCDMARIEIDFNQTPLLQSVYINAATYDTLIFKGKPQHLIELFVYEHHFTDYNFLSQLSSLESVYAGDSMNLNIDNLVSNLLKLPKLNTVYIVDGNLTKLPETFKQFKKLDWLSMVFMDSTFNLSAFFETIKDIEVNHLDLGGCQSTKLPANIKVLKKIKNLHIVSSMFTTLPEEIGELTQLEEISASMGSLSSLPNAMVKLINLKVLGVMPCEFTTIPEVLYQMTWLKELEVGSNEWFPTDEELKPLRKKLKGCKVNDFGG
ncbi:MAG: hypothetical protein V4613_05600 [Bacteroidota bacterium]